MRRGRRGHENRSYFFHEEGLPGGLSDKGVPVRSGRAEGCLYCGAYAGTEIQQLYICSQLVRSLRRLNPGEESQGTNEILVIPSLNQPCLST